MNAMMIVGGLVGRVNHSVHPGGRCAVCSRRYRDLDRHWATAHEWLTPSVRPTAQLSPESSPSISITKTL
jgi:hypothetical protein